MVAQAEVSIGQTKARNGWFPSFFRQSTSPVTEADISPNSHFSVETSFVPDSPPVERMRQAFEKNGALVWYELLQNAYDYNDFSTGNPTVTAVLKDGKRIPLSQLRKTAA